MATFIRRVRPIESILIPLCRVDKYPLLKFLVVINPNMGAENGTSLNADYLNALPNLTSRENVIIVGYVNTNVASRNIEDVANDINSYGSLNGNLAIDGIFFDQTPFLFTNDSFDYMNQLDDIVKAHSGFGGMKLVSYIFVGLANKDRS
jgi:hypothetical protein